MVVHVECVCEWEIVCLGAKMMLRFEVVFHIRFVLVNVSGKWSDGSYELG